MGMQRQVALKAQAQHGVISVGQLAKIGVPDRTVRTWREGGHLERVQVGVYRVGGAPATWEQSVMATVLAVDGIASHRTAARLWSMHDSDHVEVTVVRARRGQANGATVHRSRDLHRRYVTKRNGIPVTNRMRRWSTSAPS